MTDAASKEVQPAAHVRQLRRRVDDALQTLVSRQEPEGLYEPVRFVLAGQGKRVRPLLLLLVAEAYEVDVEDALPTALAVEVFHNFTLVHDDIMDGADTRRGRSTVHVRWDEDTAILCGDLLMGLSYDLLARSCTDRLSHLMQVYHRMVQRLCEGQALDKAFETRRDVSVKDYLRMIDRKTAALLQCSLELGGLLGGAGDEGLSALRKTGLEMGRAFQIQDDLLDLVADDDRWGKEIGGDLMIGKKTFLLLRTLERATGAERQWFARIVESGGLPSDKVSEARERMDRLGVLDEARTAVARHTEAAREELDLLPDAPATDMLRWFLTRMEARMH